MGHNDRGVLDRVGAVYVARIVAPPGDAVAEGAAEGAVAIETPEGIRTAEVAIGCMVRPQPGDEVSVLLDRTGAAIVQAVLRRPEHRRCHAQLILQLLRRGPPRTWRSQRS